MNTAMKIRHNNQIMRYKRIICLAFLLCLMMTSCSYDKKETGKTSGLETSQKQKDKTTAEESAKAPVIEKQPDSIKVVLGEPAHFSIGVAKSDSLKFQWQEYNKKESGWTDIEGANEDCYIIIKTKQGMNGSQYRCIVSNSAGKDISDEAVLTVIKDKT